jgi:HMG box factor
MTIPFINKIKVLSRISPPVSRSTHAPTDVRGVVVAVEGSDATYIATVGRYLEECLAKEAELMMRSWTNEVRRLDRARMDTPTSPHMQSNESFMAYLDEIHAWHRRSAEMTNYVTMPSEAPLSPGGRRSPGSLNARIPVALLPSGFSLSLSDCFAARIPIDDAYAPVDHWQWTATLWRGIVGPDLTVYVQGPEERDDGRSVGAATAAVEVRSDCAAIVVRAESGGAVGDKTLRRLGFEVLEHIRSVGNVNEDKGLGIRMAS